VRESEFGEHLRFLSFRLKLFRAMTESDQGESSIQIRTIPSPPVEESVAPRLDRRDGLKFT